MEKILVVIDSHKPNLASIDFACQLAVLTQTKLTGLLIENIFFGYEPDDFDETTEQEETGAINTGTAVAGATVDSIKVFTEECRKRGIQPDVYVDKGEPIQEIIYESRFADLLVIDPAIDFYDRNDQLPSHLVKEVLASAECPVILSPGVYNGIDEIIFCYDGSASSVFAIKQFTYLLPQLSNKKVLLLEVTESRNTESDESHLRVLAWLQAHFHSAAYHRLHGNSKDELFTYLLNKANRLVVMGAYGRSFLSRFFKKSNADMLIRTIDLPLFITHH